MLEIKLEQNQCAHAYSFWAGFLTLLQQLRAESSHKPSYSLSLGKGSLR